MAPVARYSIVIQRYNGTEQDDYGNETETWAAPVEARIYGVNFPKSSEPSQEGGHNRLIVDRVLLVPPSFVCDERDRIQLSDGLYEVVGVVEKADRNPFNWNPGGHVNVRRVDG